MPYGSRAPSAAVLGLGRSGLAVLRFLRERGIPVTAYDANPAARSAAEAEDVPFARLTPETRIDERVIFRSPVIRPDYPPISAALADGAYLSDEISLFSAHCPCPMLAVTGSDGKTTTATLIAEALKAGGHRVFLGGNVGRSLLPALAVIRPNDLVVLELSSFQLMTARLSAAVGAITNLTPNHLNWHKDLEEYGAAKRRLYGMSRRRVLRDGLFPELSAVRVSVEREADFCLSDGKLCAHGEPILAAADMRLRGRHNIENTLTAMAATEPFVPFSVYPTLMKEFGGVRHRMEWVGHRRGIDCINSSIDTSPLRTATTLSALAAEGVRPVVLIGGAEKGLSLTPLIEALATLSDGVLLFGNAERVAAALSARGIPFSRYDGLEEAVRAALTTLPAGATLLLSPAFTSFDAYPDYEARGEAFCRAVRQFPE